MVAMVVVVVMVVVAVVVVALAVTVFAGSSLVLSLQRHVNQNCDAAPPLAVVLTETSVRSLGHPRPFPDW